MDETTRQRLLREKQRMTNILIERVKRDFKQDIAIIGLSGSFANGDFHEHSDIDFVIINETTRGADIARSFILGDIGYDFYCSSWDWRLEQQASLQTPHIASLVDMQLLYCAKPAYLERFSALRQRALDELSKPIGPDCLARAKQHLEQAKLQYAETQLNDSLGAVRQASCGVLEESLYALASLNNTYYKKGIKRYAKEIRSFRYVPMQFEERYMQVVMARNPVEIREATGLLLKGLTSLLEDMLLSHTVRPVPSPELLRGTYEELWSNYRHKLLNSVKDGDPAAALLAATGAQQFLDEMSRSRGTKTIDIMQYYQAEELAFFQQRFLEAMDEYLAEYHQLQIEVERYESFEQLYATFMA